MQDLTQHSPKLGKKQKAIQVYNPQPNPIVANEAGQALDGFGYGIVHPNDEVAKRAIENGFLQVTSF
jgi:hypothetical protein